MFRSPKYYQKLKSENPNRPKMYRKKQNKKNKKTAKAIRLYKCLNTLYLP